jgi:ankyrin repeat protein
MRKIADVARRCCSTALFIVAIAWPIGDAGSAEKAVASRTPPRDEVRDRQTIKLAKAIMAGDPKFRELVSSADPNAVIFINYKNEQYDLSLLTIATLLGAEDVIAALVEAGARRGYSCDFGYLITASLPLNSILPEFTTRRVGHPRIMTGQAALSCFLAAPYRKATNPFDQPLLDAIVKGNLAAVRKALSRGMDKNARELKLPGQVVWPGRTALMIALIERRFDIAESLIKSGADVNAKAAIGSRWGGVDGIDAMKIAIALKHPEILKLLLQNGAEASSVDERGNLAVHEAASRGDVTFLRELLAENPRLSARTTIVARNKSGELPLVLAVRSHRPEAVAFLIGRGKELYGSDFLEYWGSGALDEALTLRFVASQDASETDEARIKAGEILTMLLKNGADASFKDEDGRTILMRAIQVGFDLSVIRSVLQGRPQIEASDRDGNNAYFFAKERSDATELKALLDSSRERSP